MISNYLGPVAQLVERYIRIVEIGSSNLPRSTRPIQFSFKFWGYGVVGSASPWHGEGRRFESG